MSLSISLYELRRLRKFLEYQEAYESRDVEADEWKDFVSVMESDKALNRLAESFGAESLASDKECPVCDESYNAVDEDGDQLCYCLCEFCSDAKPITTVRGEWVCKTCKNEHDNEPEDWMGAEGYDAEAYVHIVKDKKRDEITALVSVFKEPNLGGQALHHRHEWEDNKEKIISWATNNGYPIQYWEEENYMARPEKVDTFDAEFCSECRYDSKKAESFSAETEGGTQVFNSCWKCGSGQHLQQISRYPASPDEIAGVGAHPDQVNPAWETSRPIQR